MSRMCLVVTSDIQKLTDEILKAYPEASQRASFNANMCAEWIGAYNEAKGKQPDFIPEIKSLIGFVENKRNQDGKSFLYIPESITYTPIGKKQQTYTVIGTHIYNKDGKEVFATDSKDRRRVFANLAVQQGRAVVVEHKGKKYVVNNKDQIISVSTGDMMKWGDENGDRKEILLSAHKEFKEKETATTNTGAAREGAVNRPISSFSFFSGAATGSDTEWKKAIEAKGGKVQDFTVKDYDLLSKEEKDKVEKEYYEVVAFIGRRPISATSFSGKLVRRDMMQADNADAVFAIGSFDPSTQKVNGGTAYAVGRAILDNKPVYIFNQEDDTWYSWDNQAGAWWPCDTPVLTQKAAVVGTRELKNNGKRAIEYVINKTFSQNSAINMGEPRSIKERYGSVVSDKLISAMQTGNWDKEAIDEFNNLIERIKDGEIEFRRRVGEGRAQKTSVSGVLEGASIIARGNKAAVQKEPGNAKEKLEVDAREGKEQERLIEAWAKAADLWLNDYEDADGKKANTLEDLLNSQWEYMDQGSESEVYLYDGTTLLKSINLSHTYDNPGLLLDKIYLFNSLFPETAMEVVGFGRDSLGQFRIIVTQPFVKGRELTDAEVDDFHKKHPHDKVKGLYVTGNGAALVSDLGNSNILKGDDGEYYVIDADAMYNTPYYGGNVILESSLSLSSQTSDTINPQESRLSEEEKKEIEQIVTVAPYFRNRLTTDNKEQLVESTKEIKNKAQKLADTLGLEIEAVEIVGGTYLGNSEITYQYKVKSSDQEAVDLFAALMGDLSYEYQDAVIAANYTKDKSEINAYEITWKAPEGTTIEEIEALLKSLGIDGSTYHFNNGELDIIAFSEEETQEIINKLKDTDYEFKEYNGQNSRYLDNEYRRNAYQSWLNSERGKQDRKLYNACQKALAICEAAAQYPDVKDAENHPEEQRKQEKKRIAAAKEAAEKWKPEPPTSPSGESLSSTSPSNAAPIEDTEDTGNLAATATGFTLTREEAIAAARKQEEANKPKPEKPKSVAYESALDVKDSRVAQFNRVFSPQQIKDRGAMISGIFSRILDDAVMDEIDSLLDIVESDTASEDEKNQAKRRINALRDPVNGRQLAAQEKGLDAIIDEIKQEIEWNLESADDDTKILWQNTFDYFEDLFNTQATLDIEEREGIRILGLKFAEKTASEEDNDTQDDGDDEVGHTASGSDGWGYQVRYTNPFDSLSRKVRGMLYEIERPEGEKDDLGQTRYYPMGQIYASLLSYLAKNMKDSDDFMSVDKSYVGQDRWGNDITETTYPNGFPTFPVLEQMKTVYPWVQQIIDRLTDDYLNPEWNTSLRYPSTGGSMASQFYTNFRKAYIPYAKIQLGDGKFGITPLNYEMEERAQYDKLEANYNNRMILTDHSIYNSDGKVSKENAEWLKGQLKSVIDMMDRMDLVGMPELIAYYEQDPENSELTDEDIKEYNDFLDTVRMLIQSFGIDATQESVVAYSMMDNGKVLKDMLSDLHYIADTVGKIPDDKVDSFNYILDTRDSYNRNMWSHFFDGRGLITDASYMQSFYDSASKKTKYSYSADNYLMKMFRGAAMGTLEERRAFIDEHFGKYEWFRSQNTGEWRNKWLEFWYNYTGDEKEIPYRNVDNVTEYGENGVIIRQYGKWEPDDIWQVQTRSYNPDSDSRTAFYLAPIFSDSPMSMTVKGPRMNMEELLYGYIDENNDRHQGALVSLVNQELYRIGYVQERAKAIEEGRVKPIANFDGKRGQQFCFLPELNTYVFEDTGNTFLEEMVLMKENNFSARVIEERQIQAIRDIIDRKMGEYMAENRQHYMENPISPEQYYNMVYANAAIIQMTTVDLAFYKDDTDFQKRFKEVYAGGIQLNTNSKYGKKTENVILLSDDIITSPSYDKIAAIIDSSESLSETDKQEIKASFMDINVADAQAIRSMHSFRSVLDMMGNWTDEMETALNHFKEGTWDRADFDIIYQTIKPFVYSVIDRNDGFGSSILVPQQNKNSEICALMMYDLIVNGLEESPVYKALSRFMEETVDGDGNPLIDMIQYESAGKVGNQGVVNISFNPNKVLNVMENDITSEGDDYTFYPAEDDNGKPLPLELEYAEQHYYAIKEQLDDELAKGNMSQKAYNKIMQYLRPTEEEIISMLEQAVLVTNPDGTKGINPEIVHTIPFDNYYQQQPTPEHHIDAEATFGSQTRNIIVADLPEDFELVVPVKGGRHTFKGRDAVIDFYYELLNENLIEDFFGKGNKRGLKGIFSSKEALRDAVTEIVRGNPKYGKDFAEALQLDDDGNFVLNPNSPTIFNLMQEIVTSFFKNRITKQTINGAALIQAAGIGLDENLRIEFDEDGKVLGAHCLMPLTSKRFFEPLLETQVINGKEVQVLSPEKLKKAGLDKAIGYRIPTENKSSMMPLIIDGFTPLQNGSAIVLPAEITNIAGSDFDVDKMFIMLLSFYIQNYDMRKAREDYAKENAIYNEILSRFTNSQLAEELLDDDTDDFKEWFEERQEDYKLAEPVIRKIEYDFNKTPKENGRRARNNMLIQMMYGILTSKPGSESLLNPQGFKDVKRAAKITRILTDNSLLNQLIKNTSEVGPGVLPTPDRIVGEFLELLQEKYPEKYDEYKNAVLKMTAEEVQEMYIKAVTAGNKEDAIKLLMDSSTKDLEKFIKEYSAPESPVFPQTFAHSHAKNMAGANQIGIYAIQGSMDAKYQRASVRMREEQQFTINGRVIANVDVSDEGKRLKNVGQMIGASADNGKDPNLSDMGSTTKTAPMIGYMLRTGMTHLEAALVINQRHMQDSRYSSKNYKYWSKILGKNPLAVPTGNVTTDMLIKSLISPFELTVEEDKAIAALCYRILCQHEAQEYLTQISRADSPNGALKNSYAKGRIQRYKVDLFNAKMGQKDFPFVRISEAVNNNTIDTTASEDVVREQLKGQRMAFLQGMYALGINSFNGLVAPYFFGAREWFDNDIVKPILYNLNEKLSDEKKEQIVNAIYVSYITFMLSGSSLFGNEEGSTMKSKREYYLETFPSDYQKIIQENEDIRDLLGNILQVKNFGSRKRVILQDVGSLSKGQKQDVQRRFDALLYSDNPVARNLAKDLLLYSYFDNGLQFTHDSFSHLFTTQFLTNFPVYNETLSGLEERITPEEETNFIHQFLLTYPEAAYNVNEIISSDNVANDIIRIDLNDKKMRMRMINEVMSPNPQLEGINVYPYIQYHGDVYVLDSDLFAQFPGTPIYRKLTKYQTFPRLPLFSKQMSVAEMAKEFPVSDDNSQREELPSVDEVNAPMAHNEGSGDPNVGPDVMYDSFEAMDDFEAPDYDDLITGETQSQSDNYQAEGEGELQSPMCK